MTSQVIPAASASTSLQARFVYVLAGFCLVLGLVIGYFSRKAQLSTPATLPVASLAQDAALAGSMPAGHMPSLADMHRMADTQAAPLLAKLKSDPNNSTILAQVGGIY